MMLRGNHLRDAVTPSSDLGGTEPGQGPVLVRDLLERDTDTGTVLQSFAFTTVVRERPGFWNGRDVTPGS